MDASVEAKSNMMVNLNKRLKEFIESEAMSCSMDFGCITPEYVYRMLGGQYSIDEIRNALNLCLKEYYER